MFSNITLNDFAPFLELWIGTCILLLYQTAQKKILFQKSKIKSTQNVYSNIESRFKELCLQFQGIINTEKHFDYYAYYLSRLKRITSALLVFGIFVLICMGFEKSNNHVLYQTLIIADISVICYIFGCILWFKIIKKQHITFSFILLTVFIIIIISLFGTIQNHYMQIVRPFALLFTLFICVMYPFVVYFVGVYDSYIIGKTVQRLDELNKTIDSLFNTSVNLDTLEDIPKPFRDKVKHIIHDNQSFHISHFNKYVSGIIKDEYKRLNDLWMLDTTEEIDEVFSDSQIQQIKQIINDCLTNNHINDKT